MWFVEYLIFLQIFPNVYNISYTVMFRTIFTRSTTKEGLLLKRTQEIVSTLSLMIYYYVSQPTNPH